MLWLIGRIALLAGLTRDGAAGGPGGGAFVVLIKMCSAGNAPLTCRAMSGLPSRLKSPATMSPPATLDLSGGTSYSTSGWKVSSPLPFKISIRPELPSPKAMARSWLPSPL